MGKYIRLITFLGKAKKETAVKTTISLAVVALSFTQAFFLAQGVCQQANPAEMRCIGLSPSGRTTDSLYLVSSVSCSTFGKGLDSSLSGRIYQEDGSKSQKRYSGCHVGKVDGIRSVLPQ